MDGGILIMYNLQRSPDALLEPGQVIWWGSHSEGIPGLRRWSWEVRVSLRRNPRLGLSLLFISQQLRVLIKQRGLSYGNINTNPFVILTLEVVKHIRSSNRFGSWMKFIHRQFKESTQFYFWNVSGLFHIKNYFLILSPQCCIPNNGINNLFSIEVFKPVLTMV